MFELSFDFENLTRLFNQQGAVWPQIEEIAVPESELGRSFVFAKSKVSDPSTSVDEVNVPEVFDQKAHFVYNFYTKDERVSPFKDAEKLPPSKVARYVKVTWNSPQISQFESRKVDLTKQSVSNDALSIKNNAEKILSEDNFFNPGFVNHTFSSIDTITQGTADIENYSAISRHNADSLFKMAKIQLNEIVKTVGDTTDSSRINALNEFSEVYTNLVDFPNTSLGLRTYDERGNLIDDKEFLQSLSDSLKLNVKINNSIIPDIFINSIEKNNSNYKALEVANSQSKTSTRQQSLSVVPVLNEDSSAAYLSPSVKLIGYIVDRYLVTPTGFKKEQTFYVEDIQKNFIEDKTVLYGFTYLYSIRVVASLKMLTYAPDGVTVNCSVLYVSSKPVSTSVECYEFSPPPEPNNIRFTFDYIKRNLIILWDTPVNPQKDIKQFQVFRRKSIKEPFELIAQYGFDQSDTGAGSDGRYKTGERIDANNYYSMLPDDRHLIKVSEKPVYMHVDNDFTVDPEFFVSSNYIYAIAAIDAHGMISNYSSQHQVTFDPYKNRLVTNVICDAGSPRQYPNMKLRTDAFKDVISIEGLSTRQMQVYFTPEYLKVKDDRNVTYNIVEAQTQGSNSYYLFQLINLDNQKMQLLKINVKDPQNLTL